MAFLPKLLLLFLIALPTSVFVADGPGVAMAQEQAEDVVEGEDEEDEDEAEVETESDEDAGGTETAAAETEEEEEEEEEEEPLKASPDADTTVLFTTTNTLQDQQIPATKLVRVLVGFTNKGDKDFIVESMEGAFRYPQDYSFYIQNFTTFTFNTVVQPNTQASFEYLFTAAEPFAGRPFGLTIALNYKDTDGNPFLDAVFNETISVVELDEGLDGEMFFLYIFLAAAVVLLIIGGQQLMASMGKKRPAKKQVVEQGTQNQSDVDFDWIPKETVDQMNKNSPRRSPRRRAKRATGSDEK
ncbi:translocon-associated protein subunit alpha-like [Branchiostoma floridae x Branchiostoma belcheri]